MTRKPEKPLEQKDKKDFPVTYNEAFWVWVKVAINSFGGPAGQIAVMHKLLVEDKKWISENRFLHALNYCMVLPGPEAQQLATYIGYLMHKTKGGLTAGLLFVLPGFLSILILSIIYALFHNISFVQAIFFGIKPAIIAIVIGAVVKIGKKAIKNEVMLTIAILSFLALFLFSVPFPYVIAGAALLGYFGGKIALDKFNVIKVHADKPASETGLIDAYISSEKPDTLKTHKTAFIWLLIWLVPVILLYSFLGKNDTLVKEAVFFSKAAVVTFGGAYSVLEYIAQKAVEEFQWLKPGEMLDGLGMAETTPGPLIQVVQFVGFMGAFRNPSIGSPLFSAIIASVVVTWVTYAPCFFYIFTGSPYIEYLRGNKNLTAALSGITAAVVGVILNLSIWFAVNVLFKENYNFTDYGLNFLIPKWESFSWQSFVLTILSNIVFFGLKLNMFKTIFISVLAGIILYFIF